MEKEESVRLDAETWEQEDVSYSSESPGCGDVAAAFSGEWRAIV